MAAHRVNPTRKKPFSRYALLGDDIIIADQQVAQEYRKILEELQVSISDAKSIVSETGCIEFAKQFWVKGISKNLSPVSAKAVLASYTICGIQQLGHKYNLSEKTCFKLNGAGYRVLGKMSSGKLSRRFKRVLALTNKRIVGANKLPLEWWIGRLADLSPYVLGRLISYAVGRIRLKQLKPPTREMFWNDGEEATAETLAYRQWMMSWLNYLKWFVLVTSSPSPRLEDLFSPPIVSCTWRRKDEEKETYLQTWSIVYALYDMAEGVNPGTYYPAITGGYLMLEE